MPWWSEDEEAAPPPLQPVQNGPTRAQLEADPASWQPDPGQYPEDPFAPPQNPEWGPNTQTGAPLTGPLQRENWGDTNGFQDASPDFIGPPENPLYREAMAGRSYEPANMDWLQPAKFPYSRDDLRSVQDAMTSNEPSQWLGALGLAGRRAGELVGEGAHAVGNVLGTIGTGLQYEHQQVPERLLGEMARPDAAGWAARGVAPTLLGPLLGMSPLGDLPGAMGKPDVQEVYRQRGPQAAFEYARDRYAPVPGLIAENAVDPLNYVGGIGERVPGMAGQAIRAAEAPYNAVMGAPFKAAKVGVEAATDFGNAAIGAVSDVAHSPRLGPLALKGEGVGARGDYYQALQDAFGTIGAVRNAGYDWAQTVNPLASVGERLKALEAGMTPSGENVTAQVSDLAKGIKGAIGTIAGDPAAWQGTQAARTVENQLWKDTRQQVTELENPVNRFYGLMAQQTAAQIGNDLRREATDRITQMKAAGATQDAIAGVYRDLHAQQLAIVSSVQDAVKGFQAAPAVDIPPEVASGLDALVKATTTSVESATRAYREGLDRIRESAGTVTWADRTQGLQARDEQISAALTSAQEQAQRLLYPAGIPDTYTLPASGLLSRVQNEVQAIADGKPIFAGRVADEHVQRWPQVQQLVANAETAVTTARDEARQIFNGQALVHPEIAALIDPVLAGQGTFADAVAAIRHVAATSEDAADVAKLRSLTSRWNSEGFDLFRSDNMELAKSHIAHVLSDQHGFLGPLGGLSGPAAAIAPAVTGFINLWKNQILMSPRFVGQNVVGQVGMNAMRGVHPGQMAEGLNDMAVQPVMRILAAGTRQGMNPAAIWRGLQQAAKDEVEAGSFRGPRRVQDAMQQYQMTPPASVDQGGLGNMLLDNPEAHVRWDAPNQKVFGQETPEWMALPLRVMAGAAYGAPAGAVGAEVGGLYGAVLPKASEILRFITGITEGNARQLLWLRDVDNVTQGAIEPFAQRLAEAGMPELAHAVVGTGGRLSVQTLEDMLGRAHSPTEVVQRAVKDWANVLGEATRAGQKAVDETHFNYPVQDNIESFFRYTMPFMTWSKRAVPFFLDALSQDPRLVVALHTLNAVSQEQTTGEGKPRYLNSAMRLLPVGSQVADAIFGAQQKGGSTYFRPGQMLMPFSDVGSGDPTEGAQTPIAAGLGLLRQVGQSPAPWVDTPLRLAGAMGDRPGDRDIPGRMIRVSPFIEALTGRNPETGWQRLAGMRGGVPLDQPLLPVDTTGDIDFLVKRRIQEGAIEAFGVPLSDYRPWEMPPNLKPFQDALNDPHSPIYQQALHDVQLERGRSSQANWWAPLSVSPVRDTSERIYADQRLAPGEAARTWLPGTAPLPEDQPINGMVRDRSGRFPLDEAGILARDAAAPPLARGYGGRAPVNPDDLYDWARHYDSLPPGRQFVTDPRNPEYNRDGWLSTYLKWRGEQGLTGKVADPRAILAFLRHERPAG